MSAESKEWLIKTVYTSEGLKEFSNDVDRARNAGTKLGATLNKTSKVIDQSITSSLNKAGEEVKNIATVFETNGRRISVSFSRVGKDIVANSFVMKEMVKDIDAIGKRLVTVNAPLAGFAQRVSSLTALNKGFSRRFATTFKPGTQVVEQGPIKTSPKIVPFEGVNIAVPVEKLYTVVKSADGAFTKLNQTITYFPNGMKVVGRSMDDVTAKFSRAEKAALALAEKTARLKKEASALAAAELKTAQANAALEASFVKTGVSEAQAEKQARAFTTGLSSSAKTLETTSKTFQRNGQTVVQSTTSFADQGKKIKTLFETTATASTKLSQSIGRLKETTAAAGIDLGKLVSRALVTIPVWLALRSAVMGALQGIKGGVSDLITFDSSLQKIKRNLTGTPEEITTNFGIMKNEITQFSLETGKSVEEISEAVKSFATIGFNFKDSLSAGLDATRLSILLFGDAGETANAFASAMKLLIKEGEGLPSKQQQIAEAFALTAELAKDNKDNLSELTQGLNKFSATASTANLSAKETITLLLTLATAGRSGAQSGTLLSTTFNHLLSNLDKVSKKFGIDFNPAVDSGFSTLMKILDASEKLAATPGGEIKVIERLSDILGGERGTKVVSSLLAVNNILKENMKVTGDLGRFHSDLTTVLDSESGQAQILGNKIKEMGKSFITSVVGADNFKDAIKQVIQYVSNLEPLLSKTGLTISNFGKIATLQFNKIGQKSTFDIDTERINKSFQTTMTKLASALRGDLPAIELEKFKIEFKEGAAIFDADVNMDIINASLEKAISQEEKTAKASIKSKVAVSATITPKAEVIVSLENELAELKARLKAKGATDIELSLLDVDFLKSKSLDQSEKIRDAQSKIRIQSIEKERSIQDTLLGAIEEGAKASGATNLEAINRRIELEKQLGIQRTGMDLLVQQLDLQKALTEETKKTKQERLSELSTLIKQTPSKFSSGASKEIGLKGQEQSLRLRASFAGISDEKVNSILNPELQIAKGNTLLSDLQRGLSQPMTKSMSSLEQAISSLTQTIMQQETRPTGASVPRFSNITVNTINPDKMKKDVEKIIEEF